MGSCCSFINSSFQSPSGVPQQKPAPLTAKAKLARSIYGNCDYLFKILVVGDSGVGKTCLLSRFAEDMFSEAFIATIGIDFKTRAVELDDKTKVKLLLWDSSGDNKFRNITASFYRQPHAVVVVFDVTSRVSFENIQRWLNDVKRCATDDIVKVLVGNKCDLVENRQVSTQEAQAAATALGLYYVETSAKDSVNVTQAFIHTTAMVKTIIEA